jgi:hypothetical protein
MPNHFYNRTVSHYDLIGHKIVPNLPVELTNAGTLSVEKRIILLP